MKRFSSAIAATIVMALAVPASAAIRQIDFSFGPMTSAGGAAPFGLVLGDTVSGSFQFDDSGFTGAGSYDLQPIMTSLSLTTGTRTWSLGEVASNFDYIAVGVSNAVSSWRFQVSGADGSALFATNNTANVNGTGGNGFIYCNDCSSWSEVEPVSAVPLPASAGFVLSGLGLLGAVSMRKRRRA